MLIPNFMIIGAPKCGTTALSQYLSSHPEVCFSESKEPNYFCTDFPGYRNSFSEKEYLEKEYGHCIHGKSKAIGEGSVWYLYSKTAVSEILKMNPQAKFIVLIRNPVDVVQSLHSQMYCNQDEDIADFETAWNLQASRAKGLNIPKLCREPTFLQYQDAAMFGEQIVRLFQEVQPDRIKIILFEEFTNNTRKIYLEVLDFIGVQDDGRTNFPQVNMNKVSRSRILSRLVHRSPKFLTRLTRIVKSLTGIRRFGLYKAISQFEERINTRVTERKKISEDLRRILVCQFKDDITRLERLIGKDLGAWKE
jgi:hypothetical protein